MAEKPETINVYRRKSDALIWDWIIQSGNQSQMVSRAINLLWAEMLKDNRAETLRDQEPKRWKVIPDLENNPFSLEGI